MKAQDIELYSDEVRTILGTVPNWLIRWGITVVFLVILLFILVASLVKYPDVIRTQINITTPTLPAKVSPKQSGKIQTLLVKENQVVKKGEILAVLENSAQWTDIQHLRIQIIKIQQQLISKDSVPYINFKANVNLGEVQNEYAQFLKNYKEYRFWLVNNLYNAKINQFRRQIGIYEKLGKFLDQKKELSEKQVGLSQKKYNTEKSLHDQGVIAQLEITEKEKLLIQEKYNLASAETEPIRAELQIKDYQTAILNLQGEYSEMNHQRFGQLQQNLSNLTAKLQAWEAIYVLKSPIDGVVTMFKPLAEQQFINSGEDLLTIIPKEKEIIGYAYVNSAGIGKVKSGQKVKIYLDAFPKEEFGTVEGTLLSKSEIAENGKYLVKISLPKQLSTNYQKQLDFSQQMQGQAHIITEKLLLIQRIFYQLKYLFSEY